MIRLLLNRFLNVCIEQSLVFLVPFFILKQYESLSLSGLSFFAEWVPRIIAILLTTTFLKYRDVFFWFTKMEQLKFFFVLVISVVIFFFRNIFQF